MRAHGTIPASPGSWRGVAAAVADLIASGALIAATLALVASFVFPQWLMSYGHSPRTALPWQLLAGAVLVVFLWWRHTTWAVTAAGGVAAGAGLTILLFGVDHFAPGGAGVGGRSTLTVLALFLLAVHGLLAPVVTGPDDRRDSVWWPAVGTAVGVALSVPMVWAAVVPIPAHLNDHQRVATSARQPTFSTELTGKPAGAGDRAVTLASSAQGTVTVRTAQSGPDGSSKAPPRMVVEGRTGPTSRLSGEQRALWQFARDGAELLGTPVIGGNSVYLRYAQWGALGTDKPTPRNVKAAGKRIVALGLSSGRKIGEFDPPSRDHVLVGAGTDYLVFTRGDEVVTQVTVTDSHGTPRWSTAWQEQRNWPDDSCGYAAAVAAGDGVLVSVQCDRLPLRVELRDAASGGTRWAGTVTGTTGICGASAVDTGSTLVIATCGASTGDTRGPLVLAGFGDDGSQRWHLDLAEPYVTSYPRYRFYFYPAEYAVTYRQGSGVIVADNDGLTVIDPVTGKQLARHPITFPSDIRYPAVSVTTLGVIVHNARWDAGTNRSAPLWVD
ncbi:MAG: hypothetical protein WAV90_18645 [Gordonia amarae]